jgi:type III secretion protein Q
MTIQVDTAAKSAQAGTAEAERAVSRQTASRLAPESPLALSTISRAEAESINAFHRRRPALAFKVAGRAATMTAKWPPAPDDGCGRCRLDITVDGTPGTLILSRSVIKAIVAGLDPHQPFDHLESLDLALLLELALADALPALEASLGARLAINAVRTADEREGGGAFLAFDIAIDGIGTSAGELLLQNRHAVGLARLLDSVAASFVPAVELPVPISLRVAATTCSIGEIATLSAGDIVMADRCCRQWRTAVAVVAEHLAAAVTLTATGAQIAAPLERIHGSSWEWSMENGANRSQNDVMQTFDLDDIPVKLLFELGRIELSLAEIRQLAPGALIAMPHPLEEGVDISANGRSIGRGSLVQIGGNLGVRITRLFHNG